MLSKWKKKKKHSMFSKRKKHSMFSKLGENKKKTLHY